MRRARRRRSSTTQCLWPACCGTCRRTCCARRSLPAVRCRMRWVGVTARQARCSPSSWSPTRRTPLCASRMSWPCRMPSIGSVVYSAGGGSQLQQMSGISLFGNDIVVNKASGLHGPGGKPEPAVRLRCAILSGSAAAGGAGARARGGACSSTARVRDRARPGRVRRRRDGDDLAALMCSGMRDAAGAGAAVLWRAFRLRMCLLRELQAELFYCCAHHPTHRPALEMKRNRLL